MDWRKFKEVTPLSITVLYAVIGGLWVLFSDRLLGMLRIDHRSMSAIQTVKGWVYIGLTALLLYWLIDRVVKSLRASEEELFQSYTQLERAHEELEATHEELVATEEELKQQFDEIQAREAYYRGVYEGISSGILVHRRDGRLVHANDSAKRLLGLNQDLFPQFHVEGKTLFWEELVGHLVQVCNFRRYLEIEVIGEEGPRRWLLVYSDPLKNLYTGEEEIVTTLVDRTEEKKMEIYASILNEIDQKVLKGIPLTQIEEELCQQMVEKVGFAYVWVGSKEEDGRVAFQAQAGIKGMDRFSVRWDDSVYAQGVVGMAIRRGQPQVYAVEGNSLYSAWGNHFTEQGIRSAAAFPLIHEGEVFGAFALYSKIPDFFSAKCMTILERFSLQLALAFMHAKDRERLERFRILTEHVNEAILFIRPDGRIMDVNESAEKMYGYSREEFLRLNVRALRVPADRPQVHSLLQVAMEGLHFECCHMTKTGKVFPVEVSSKGATLKGQSMILGIMRDITERKQAEEEIWHKAHHDSLTDLPNRLLFYEHLNQAITQAKRKQEKCAVLFLDLDRFKLINDTMGHNLGDQLLKMVSQRLRQILREEDTIGRQGGDEFLLLLPEVKQEEDVALVADKILQVFATPFLLEENEVFITPSIGISIYPTDGEDRETLVKQADTAMYHAKELGRNNYQFYTEDLNTKVHERLAVENSLRKALEREEFLLYYQPQVDLNSGQINGVEALLRWHSPERGLVSPGVFIPIAEETGLIVPLGEWVLRSACVQNLKWQDMGFPPRRISVNISARQFREPKFVETVAEVLKETGLDPQWLELEITESIAMEYGEDSREQLQRLKQLGVGIAIDDFGTGYSSLNYLRRLPIGTLKIDQSFVRDIGLDENGEAVVIGMIKLAKSLQLKVIAEGVETEEQKVFLKDVNCDEMQGFLFSKPLPSGEIERLLTHSAETA